MDGSSAPPTTDLLDNLAARIASDPEGRLARAVLAAVIHVHDLVRDLRPTPVEWRDVLDFLTEVGHNSDARRQEWVLLSDVIGASTLIEDQHSVRPDGTTPNTLAGPFYRADVPDTENGANISRDGIGQRLAVSGQVADLDGHPVQRATVEVWHANSFGVYENQQPDQQPEFNLRGRFQTDTNGCFWFLTICPGGYSLPEDGPVGHLMNRLGIKLERPAHLHFRVSAAGHETLTTHIYDRTDPAIDRDALFCVKPELLGEFRPVVTDEGPAFALDVRFVLAGRSDTGAAPTQPTN